MEKNATTKTETITPAVANLVVKDLKKRGLKVEIEYLNNRTVVSLNGNCSHIAFEVPNKDKSVFKPEMDIVKAVCEVLAAHGVSTEGIVELEGKGYERALCHGEGTEKAYFRNTFDYCDGFVLTAVAVPIEGLMPIDWRRIWYIDEDTPASVVDALVGLSTSKGENGLPLIEAGNHSYLVARAEEERLEREEYIKVGNYRVYDAK